MEVQTRGLDEQRSHDECGASSGPMGDAAPDDSEARDGNPVELPHRFGVHAEDAEAPRAKQPGPAPQLFQLMVLVSEELLEIKAVIYLGFLGELSDGL